MNNFRKFVLSGLETLAPLGFLMTVVYVAFEMSSWGVLGFLLGLVVGVIVATILFGVIYTLIDISNSLKKHN